MKKVSYILVYNLCYLFSLLPLWVLYRISDMLYLLVYYIVRYRRKLVRRHLAESFPEKTEEERLDIERKFYRWFCDYAVESLKLLSISRKNISKRMRFENTERVKQSFDEGKHVALYLGHYCNWEWISSIPLAMQEYLDRVVFGEIYHPLENETMNRVFIKLRQRMDSVCIPMSETLRKLIGIHKSGKQWIIGFIADQVPLWNNIHLWLDFLHHDTPVFTGTERIARQFDCDVYYVDVRRESRGHYVARYVLMAEHAKQQPEFALTHKFFELLEQSIRRQPPLYLWTHNRWKRTHEEYNLRLDPDTGRMDMGDLNEIKRRKGML